MIKRETVDDPESLAGVSIRREQRAADALAAAIRKPFDALDGAAEEAANGKLGRAKLGLLVAANGLIAALEAVDREFARQYGRSNAGPPVRVSDRHDSDAHNI